MDDLSPTEIIAAYLLFSDMTTMMRVSEVRKLSEELISMLEKNNWKLVKVGNEATGG